MWLCYLLSWKYSTAPKLMSVQPFSRASIPEKILTDSLVSQPPRDRRSCWESKTSMVAKGTHKTQNGTKNQTMGFQSTYQPPNALKVSHPSWLPDCVQLSFTQVQQMHLMSTVSMGLLFFRGKEENKIQKLFLSGQTKLCESKLNRKNLDPMHPWPKDLEKICHTDLVFSQLESQQNSFVLQEAFTNHDQSWCQAHFGRKNENSTWTLGKETKSIFLLEDFFSLFSLVWTKTQPFLV